jgi:hypothetical protein
MGQCWNFTKSRKCFEGLTKILDMIILFCRTLKVLNFQICLRKDDKFMSLITNFKDLGNQTSELISLLESHTHVINCDLPPYVCNATGGNVFLAHNNRIQNWRWNPHLVKLYLHPYQQPDRFITGTALQESWIQKKALNANVLDYLLAHRWLIPEDWKKAGKIFFPGTIYGIWSCVRYDPYVRYLLFGSGNWGWSTQPLNTHFGADCPAATLED